MAILQIPLVKVKGAHIEVDTDKLHQDVYAYAMVLGLKALMNRGTSGEKAKGLSADEYRQIAEKQLADAYEGKTRIIGQKRTAGKKDGKEMTEAVRIAKETVKQMIKANGEKISHYSAGEITKAAKAIVDSDPETYLAAARENIAKAEMATSKTPKIDIMAMVAPDAGKVAKAAEKAAAARAQTSAAKAGKITPKAKPAPRPHA